MRKFLKTRRAAAIVLAALAVVPAIAIAAPDPLGSPVQVSNAGPAGDLVWRASFSDSASSTRFEGPVLTVWIQDLAADQLSGAVFGRMFDPVTGAPRGDAFQISETGPHSSPVSEFNPPAVTYNPTADEFLVSWNNDADSDVYARRVSSAGAVVGADIPLGGGYSDIETVVPVFSPEANEYLVVWKATLAGDQQVRGQRLAGPDGSLLGANFQISNMTSNADDAIDVAYSPALQRYLVVWHGRTAPIAGETEAYGQLLTTAGAEVSPEFRISSMGPDGNGNFEANPPSVAWNSVTGEWIVGWSGDDDTAPHIDGEYDVYAQRLSGDGAEIGADDFPVAETGVAGNSNLDASRPSISFNPNTNEFLFVWHGDDGTTSSPDNQTEVFSQRVSGAGSPAGERTQLSDVQPDGLAGIGSSRPMAVYLPRVCNWNVTWTSGDFNFGSPVDVAGIETEVFQRNLLSSGCVTIPCPTGTSATVVCAPDTDGSGIRMTGTSASETFVGTEFGDRVSAGRGNDKINPGAGSDRVDAGIGHDVVKGDAGNDQIFGRAGRDRLYGGKGRDTVKGGNDNDKVYGDAQNDKLYGEKGKDLVSGGTGNDSLFGGTQNDRLIAGKGKDRLRCGAGRDRFRADSRDKVAGDCRP